MKISWILVLLQYANLVESKAKPRLDQTSEFTTFFLKKWHKLVKNEKLNNWDEEKTERFTRNLHKLKNKIVKGTENCKNLREKVEKEDADTQEIQVQLRRRRRSLENKPKLFAESKKGRKKK